jgi:hypothetical protein
MGASGFAEKLPPACEIATARAMKPAHGSGLAHRVPHMILVQILLGLKDRVDAFRRHVSRFMSVEYERRILRVINDDVDLLALFATRVHDNPVPNRIPGRKMCTQEPDPIDLRRDALRYGMVVSQSRDDELGLEELLQVRE